MEPQCEHQQAFAPRSLKLPAPSRRKISLFAFVCSIPGVLWSVFLCESDGESFAEESGEESFWSQIAESVVGTMQHGAFC